MNRIQLGIGIVGNRITTELINQERNTYTAFGGRINSRYFFSELPLKPFIEVNIYSTLGNEKKQVLGLNMLPSIGTTFSFGSRLIFGLAYALNPRILILGSFGLIGYNSTSRTSSGGSETTFSGFDANINTLGERFTIGLYYTFFQNK